MQFELNKYQEVLNKSFEKNADMRVSNIMLISLAEGNVIPRYGGCVYCKDKTGREVCVCINISDNKTMLYYPDNDTVEYIGEIKAHFSYTGGCYCDSDGCVYGFPRNSDKLLKVDINNKTVEEIEIGSDASKELEGKPEYIGHHYGGTIIGDKVICPPRASSYALMINLKDHTCKKIYNELFQSNEYNTALAHPNGKVYFLPSKGSVTAEFNPETEKVRLIGERSLGTLIGGTVYSDGSIYVFSQLDGGLFRLDVKNERLENVMNMLGAAPIRGSYGTITHFNGRIYNVPGSSRHFFEFDPRSKRMNIISTFDDGRFNNAKWAGGALLSNGNIFLVPCKGRFAAKITFNRKPELSEEMEQAIFSKYYKPF